MQGVPIFIEPIDYPQAQLIHRQYRCATCWGVLVLYPAPERLTYVVCAVCLEDTRGFVSKHFVEQRRAASFAEAAEALRNLAPFIDGVDNPNANKEPEQILNELGFTQGE